MAGGAFNLGDVFVTFKANIDSVNNAVSDIKAKTASLGDSVDSVSKKISSVGSAFMPFSLAAGAALGLSTKAAIDFNQQMELIATQAGADQKEVDNLKDKVLALATVVGQSPDALAKGLFFIESAGFRGAAAMDILKLSAEGAAVGQTDLATTANALTSVMNTQIDGAANATEAMGNLNAIVGAGKMHFSDLNEAISSGFLVTAKTFGLSLQSVGAALATLTREGEPATEAATRLKMAITLMGAPTNQAAKTLTGLGFTMTDAQAATSAMTEALGKAHVTTSQLSDDMRQPDGILVAVQDLKTHLEDAGLSSDASAAAISRAFGGGRVAGPILALMNDTQQLGDTFTQIQQKSGSFNDAWAAQQQQAKQKMDDFKATLQVLEVQLGNAFLPTLEKIATQLGYVATWFGKLSPFEKQFLVDTLLVTAALGPLLKIFGNLTSVFGLVIKGVTAISGGFGAISTAAAVAEPAALGLGGALAAAAGPVAILAGAVLAGGIIIKVLSDNSNRAAAAASAHATAMANEGKQALTVSGAHAEAAKNVATHTQAVADNTKAQETLKQKEIDAKQKTDDLSKAHQAVTDALAKYGPNSQQYQNAIELEAKAIIANANAQDALTKAQETATIAGKNVKDSTNNLNAAHLVLNQNLPKAADLHGKLKAAQNDQSAAANDVKMKQNDLNTMVQIFGPTSKPALKAAEDLAAAHKTLADKTQSVQYWGDQVKQMMANAKAEFQNYGGQIDQITGKANKAAGALQAMNSALSSAQPKGGIMNDLKSLFHFASGVQNFSGGLAVVGENGPELVNLPSGSDVIPNNRISGWAGSGISLTVSLAGAQIIGAVPQDIAEKIGNSIVDKLKRTVRI